MDVMKMQIKEWISYKLMIFKYKWDAFLFRRGIITKEEANDRWPIVEDI